MCCGGGGVCGVVVWVLLMCAIGEYCGVSFSCV